MDLRTFTPVTALSATLTAAGKATGFEAGVAYLVLGVGIDIAVTPPAPYALLVDGAGRMAAVDATQFALGFWIGDMALPSAAQQAAP